MAHPLIPFASIGLSCCVFEQFSLALSLVQMKKSRIDVLVGVDLEAFALAHFSLPFTLIYGQNLLWGNDFLFLAKFLCEINAHTKTFFLPSFEVDLAYVVTSCKVVCRAALFSLLGPLFESRKVELLGTFTQTLLDALSKTLLQHKF